MRSRRRQHLLGVAVEAPFLRVGLVARADREPHGARRLAVLEGQAVSADLQALRRRLIDQGVKPDSPSLRGLDRIIARAAGGRAAPARSGRREIVN